MQTEQNDAHMWEILLYLLSQLEEFEVVFWDNSDAICFSKAELQLLKLIHLFATEVLLVKKLEIQETKTTI